MEAERQDVRCHMKDVQDAGMGDRPVQEVPAAGRTGRCAASRHGAALLVALGGLGIACAGAVLGGALDGTGVSPAAVRTFSVAQGGATRAPTGEAAAPPRAGTSSAASPGSAVGGAGPGAGMTVGTASTREQAPTGSSPPHQTSAQRASASTALGGVAGRGGTGGTTASPVGAGSSTASPAGSATPTGTVTGTAGVPPALGATVAPLSSPVSTLSTSLEAALGSVPSPATATAPASGGFVSSLGAGL